MAHRLREENIKTANNPKPDCFYADAGFLVKHIEECYRTLKLKNKVWEKITPVALQYLVGRAFLHAVQALGDSQPETSSNDVTSFSSQDTREYISSGASSSSASVVSYENYSQELKKIDEEYNQRCLNVAGLLDKVSEKLQNQYIIDIIDDFAAKNCALHEEDQISVGKESDLAVEQNPLTVDARGDSTTHEPKVSDAEKLYKAVTSYPASGLYVSLQQDLSYPAFSQMLHSFENCSKELFSKIYEQS